ncbi:MAG TPA: 30S ribosomal protein S14 [Gemmatimonadaceae bacterium]|nr:30S ribosomal protein S14 [Gemmatimonadaceae bacterium]
MAKKSSIEKNERRKKLAAQYAAKRRALKEIVRKPSSTAEERAAAQVALAKLPRNSAPERVRHRCSMTGRSRGNIREFGLSRIAFREMALMGLIPGVRKASW